MKNILFVDSNVFLDAFLNRAPNDEDCKALLSLAEKGNVKIYTSSSCLLIVMYFLKKAGLSNEHIIQAVADLLSFVSLMSPSENIFLQAIRGGFTDLEDAVQYYTALQIKGIDYFLTSNTKDFKKASVQLPVITATQFTRLYNKKVTTASLPPLPDTNMWRLSCNALRIFRLALPLRQQELNQ